MIDDLRHSPATLSLSVLWVLIFLLMKLNQGHFDFVSEVSALRTVDLSVAHQFGDASSAELMAGELWRAVTSTFVHYSLLHLLLNLFGLVQLGAMIEEWYGSPQFLAIYLGIGGIGNLIAGLARPWFGVNPLIHSGGGSTVVFGLIALCAVVGFRSHRKEGWDLGVLMLIFLVLNVVIGVGFWLCNRLLHLHLPNFDHLAHTGGALVGTGIGLWHKSLRTWCHSVWASRAGMASAALLIACMAVQTQTSRAERAASDQNAVVEERARQAHATLEMLVRVRALYRLLYLRGLYGESSEALGTPMLSVDGKSLMPLPATANLRADLKQTLDRLDRADLDFENGTLTVALRRVRSLAHQALSRPPTGLKLQEFETRMAPLLLHAQQDQATRVAELNELARKRRRSRR